MPKTVLLCDDEEMIQELCAHVLKGYRVLSALDASAAIGIVANKETPAIDLALIDVRLVGMDGRDLLRILRQMQPGMKAAYLTGLAEEHVDEFGTPVIYKPFTADALTFIVRELIGEP